MPLVIVIAVVAIVAFVYKLTKDLANNSIMDWVAEKYSSLLNVSAVFLSMIFLLSYCLFLTSNQDYLYNKQYIQLVYDCIAGESNTELPYHTWIRNLKELPSFYSEHTNAKELNTYVLPTYLGNSEAIKAVMESLNKANNFVTLYKNYVSEIDDNDTFSNTLLEIIKTNEFCSLTEEAYNALQRELNAKMFMEAVSIICLLTTMFIGVYLLLHKLACLYVYKTGKYTCTYIGAIRSLFNRNKHVCIRCGRKLTDTEIQYYECQCERCESYFNSLLKED